MIYGGVPQHVGNAARAPLSGSAAGAPLSGSAAGAGPGSSFPPLFPNPTSWWGGSPYQYPNTAPSQQWAPIGSQERGPSTHSHPPVLATPTHSAPSTEPDEDSVNLFLSEWEREGLLGSEESGDEDIAVPGKRKYLPGDSTVKCLNSVTVKILSGTIAVESCWKSFPSHLVTQPIPLRCMQH